MWFFKQKKMTLPTEAEALPGREQPLPVAETHVVLGTSMQTVPEGNEVVAFGLGCFWGAEKAFWKVAGVYSTSVGYAAGHTPNPTYEEVCSGQTGHNEVVRVVFDPSKVTFATLLKTFFESHDPTQGMRQGNDRGTQYRSGIYWSTEAQAAEAQAALEAYGVRLAAAGYGAITTEVLPAGPYYFAEDYHQQYLHKNPNGYCGLGGTGVSCPVGLSV